jgi:AcrR family transcriptional regulator
MSERTNRKDLMVKTAAQLFAKYGYQATSTRQIAEEVGCTEAALYYHFKQGKHGLLRAVIEARLPEVQSVLAECRQATSLKEALQVFAYNFAKHTPGIRWIIAELPQLSEQERAVVLDNFAAMRDGLADTIQQFMADKAQADHLAWLMVCIGAGYQELFAESAFGGRVDLSAQELMDAFVALID